MGPRIASGTSAGRPSEAEAENRRALEIKQKLADDDPTITEFRNNLANSHISLGRFLASAGKPAGRGGRIPPGAWTSTRSWPPTAPPSPTSAITLQPATATSTLPAVAGGQAGGGGARAPPRGWRFAASWPPTTPPSGHSAREPVRSRRTTSPAYSRSLGRAEEARDGKPGRSPSRNGWSRRTRQAPRSALALAEGLRCRAAWLAATRATPPGAAADTRAYGPMPRHCRRGRAGGWFETACCHAASLRPGRGTAARASRPTMARASRPRRRWRLCRKAVGRGAIASVAAFRTEDALDRSRQREDFKKLLTELEQKSAAKPRVTREHSEDRSHPGGESWPSMLRE